MASQSGLGTTGMGKGQGNYEIRKLLNVDNYIAIILCVQGISGAFGVESGAHVDERMQSACITVRASNSA